VSGHRHAHHIVPSHPRHRRRVKSRSPTHGAREAHP
jgi:hypothetical protein